MRGAEASRWFIGSRVDRPRARIYGFAHAGGSSAAFRSWVRVFPPDVEFLAIESPGHGRRLLEPPIPRLIDLAASIERYMLPDDDVPFAFVGISMGGVVALEVALHMQASGRRLPEWLAVSGTAAPGTPRGQRPIGELEDGALVEALRLRADTPKAVLQNSELMDLLLPGIRSDFQAVETYVPRSPRSLGLSIWATVGRQDANIHPPDLDGWGAWTATFESSIHSGGHLFCYRDARFASELKARVDAIARPRAQSARYGGSRRNECFGGTPVTEGRTRSVPQQVAASTCSAASEES